MYMNARNAGSTQAQAAAIAEFSPRSGQRIEAGVHQPQRGGEREWRTRSDPLSPVTLYEYLQQQYPGEYPTVLRTLQRRVREWKALHGTAPEVMFELRHEPGMMGISDFTELKQVEIIIAGRPYEHLLYHYRLAYSGWQYAQIIEGGESFIALCQGLQNALFASGGVPKQHRTDSLSAAYRNHRGKGSKRVTHLYDHLCEHYRLQPTRNNTGIAHENGAIESPHGHLKNRLRQGLYLRGSFEFESVEHYQDFVNAIVAKLNERCSDKFKQEQPYLQPLPKYRVADYEVLTVRVSRRSTIDVRCVLYTVPSRLIGHQLQLHLYHNRILGYLGQQCVVELPRIRVKAKHKHRGRCINYRHVVEGLRRKPRAFLYCTWRDELLPNDLYRQLWQQMEQDFELDAAAVLMVEALYIAATQNQEAAVAEYLEDHLTANTLSLAALRQHFQLLCPPYVSAVTVQQHNLCDYDHLLPYSHGVNSLSELEPPSQKSKTVPHAQPVGTD